MMNNVIKSLQDNELKYKCLDLHDDVIIYFGIYNDKTFEQLLKKYIFVKYCKCFYFCSDNYIYINNKIIKINRIFSNKHDSVISKKILANDGYVYRIANKNRINKILEQYDLLINNNIGRKHIVQIEIIDSNILKEQYIYGADLQKDINIKLFIMYYKLIFVLFCENILLADINKSNVIYNNGKLFIVDLDDKILDNKLQFIHFYIKHFICSLLEKIMEVI